MGPDAGKHLRNIAIVVVMAAIVWRIQAGREAADAISNALTIIFLGGIAFLGFKMYMEHRYTLFDLPENGRAIVYFSLATALFVVVATRRMWDAGGVSILLWFALIGAAAYGVFSVVSRYRAYE